MTIEEQVRQQTAGVGLPYVKSGLSLAPLGNPPRVCRTSRAKGLWAARRGSLTFGRGSRCARRVRMGFTGCPS